MTDRVVEPSPTPASPTVEPLLERGLAPVLARNIAALQERRRREGRDERLQTRLARAITRFTAA